MMQGRKSRFAGKNGCLLYHQNDFESGFTRTMEMQPLGVEYLPYNSTDIPGKRIDTIFSARRDHHPV